MVFRYDSYPIVRIYNSVSIYCEFIASFFEVLYYMIMRWKERGNKNEEKYSWLCRGKKDD